MFSQRLKLTMKIIYKIITTCTLTNNCSKNFDYMHVMYSDHCRDIKVG